MEKTTLRKFLLTKRLKLYEEISEIKDVLLSQNWRENDMRNLEIKTAELNLINSIIELCKNRNKF